MSDAKEQAQDNVTMTFTLTQAMVLRNLLAQATAQGKEQMLFILQLMQVFDEVLPESKE